MTADFLLELLSEEIPARMQEKACADLARLFAEEIGKAGLAAASVETFATPRRLALIARGLPAATEAVTEETKGPRANAPPQALEGFLRKSGLRADQLVERGGVLFAIVEKPGRATAEVLAQAIPAIVRGFPWPKSMRWGSASAETTSLRWVRPLHGLIALLGDAIVPCEVDGAASGATTVGHRFHHPDTVAIAGADDYATKLRAAQVIVDQRERRAIIRDSTQALAAAAGLTLAPDEGLVAENAGLTEWPVPLLGSFDREFLEVPREVIQLSMRTNQKYFACTDAAGALAPNFICTANIVAADGGAAIVAGNGRVLAARLADARFFWEQDRKVKLAVHAEKLAGIVFHEKLGTVADKVERVAKLARWLIEEGIVKGADPHQAERAARLSKADLVTGMVGEFPELQGVIGGYYARAEGYPDAVADAIRDHYKPVGQGDEVPTAPVTVAVSLADKLDTVACFFAAEELPTGSKDPFALRRAMLAVLALLQANEVRASWSALFEEALEGAYEPILAYRLRDVPAAEGLETYRWPSRPDQDDEYGVTQDVVYAFCVEAAAVDAALSKAPHALSTFLLDRLNVQQREAGVRHDLIDAVFALGGEDDLVRLLARVKALQAFVATEDGANLLAGYRRAANIVRIERKKDEGAVAFTPVIAAEAGIHSRPGGDEEAGVAAMDSRLRGNDGGLGASYVPEPAEAALIAALDVAEPAAAAAVAREDFEGAMAALARLRPAVDAFFDQVTVNDADPAKRHARLALLDRIRVAVHNVADFSRIEG